MEKIEEKSFEESLELLEKIVSELESGNVSLDDAINKYTDAINLAKHCSEKLSIAEEKIAKIVMPTGELKEFEVE